MRKTAPDRFVTRPGGSNHPRTAETAPLTPGVRSGFTLVEMLVVIVVIATLIAVSVGIFAQARDNAWKQRARATARQLAVAWNQRLLDDGVFPTITNQVTLPGISGKVVFQTTPENMQMLNINDNAGFGVNKSYIYMDQTADERVNGMKDHWGNGGTFFYVQWDPTYQHEVINPIDGSIVHANVMVWSLGPHPSNPTNSYCMAWQ